MRRISVFAGIFGLALMGGIVGPSFTAAHEPREVANGQYELVVGFFDEPAFVGEKNAVIVNISRPSAEATPAPDGQEPSGAPVEGVGDTLQIEVIYGDQKLEIEVRPLFGQPGSYVAYFFPMAEGDYSFRVFGEIEGNAIDETFTSGPETFSPVQPREPLEFPKL